MKEIWRNIVGYEGLYQVSNWGRVKSLNYNHTGQEMILKTKKGKEGYLRVGLWKDGKQKWFGVHRLVAEVFITNLDNLPCVNHRDEVKTNNFVENLEWCTYEYNNKYKTRTERAAKTNTNGKTSKIVYQFTLDGTFVREWPSTMEVQRQTGWWQSEISACCRGEYKQSYGFLWSYDKDFLLFKSDNSNLTSLSN